MPQKKLTSQQLAQELIEAIKLFPTFNPAQHKKYLVGLLVLKRISDMFMERLSVEGEDDPNLFDVYVPKQARWEEIRKETQNLGDVLNRAINSLERQNSHLLGLLSWIDFNNPQEMPEDVLNELLQHFDAISLKDGDLENGTKTVGEAFIEFIAYIAEEHERREASKRLTPPDLNKLLARLAEPKAGQRVYDPAAGTASTLIAAAQEVGGKVALFGQEIDPENHRLAKINVLLHQVDASLEYGDTLRSPAFVDGSQVRQFDIVVSHPEFSRGNWGAEEASNDPFKRFEFGVPPNSNGDWAFIQHILASLNENGKAVVLMPHGVLFRNTGNEREIRKQVIQTDCLEAVIGLPEKIFFGVGIPGVVLVFNKSKAEEHKGKVIFVNGGSEYESGTKRNRLRDEDIDRIVKIYKKFETVGYCSKVVSLDEIAQNDYNLNLSRYLPLATDEEVIDLNEVQSMLEEIKNKRSNLEKALQSILDAFGGEAE